MDGEDILNDKLALHTPAIRQRALAAHALIRSRAPGASELHYTTQAVSVAFTLSDRLKEGFLHVAVYKNHVNLGFNYGATLDDPQGLLKGKGRSIRHVRLEADTLERSEVLALIEQAIAQGEDMAADRRAPPSVVRKS